MGTMLFYSIYSGIFLLAGFAGYRFLLSGEKQPSLNRAAILGIYLVSLLALPVSALFPKGGVPSGAFPVVEIGEWMANVVGGEDEDAAFPVGRIVLWSYMAGAAMVLLWTLVAIVRLAIVVKSGRRIEREGYVLVVLSGDVVPFSFTRYVVMGEKDASASLDIITAHELGHLRHHHWLDLLLAQAVCVLMWYNPASWLLRRELRCVHEYQADSTVLGHGVDVRQYQMLLIEKAVGVRLQSLANSLDHSNLSKRITMMCKQENKMMRRFRVAGIIPALALAAFAVNLPAVASTMESVRGATLADKVTQNPSAVQKGTVAARPAQDGGEEVNLAPFKIADYPGGMAEMMRFLSMNIHYPEEAIKAGIEGNVIIRFVVGKDGRCSDFEVMKGISPELDAEAVRVAKMMPKWIPGENEDGKAVATKYTLPVRFKLTKEEEKSGSGDVKKWP